MTHMSSVSGSHVNRSPAKSDLFILQINIHKRKKNSMYSSKEGTTYHAWASVLEPILSTIFGIKSFSFRKLVEMLRNSKCKQSKTTRIIFLFLEKIVNDQMSKQFSWISAGLFWNLNYSETYNGLYGIEIIFCYISPSSIQKNVLIYFSLIIYILLNVICICRDI